MTETLVFLLTRLCEARRGVLSSIVGLLPISTHAPLRGATSERGLEYHQIQISTHAPLRGATKEYQMKHLTEMISTHAPLRGAT